MGKTEVFENYKNPQEKPVCLSCVCPMTGEQIEGILFCIPNQEQALSPGSKHFHSSPENTCFREGPPRALRLGKGQAGIHQLNKESAGISGKGKCKGTGARKSSSNKNIFPVARGPHMKTVTGNGDENNLVGTGVL